MSEIKTVPATSTPPMVHVPVSPGPRPSMPSDQQGMTARDVMRILKKRLWLITGLATAIIALTVAVTYVWLKYFPSYTAVALVEVKAPIAPPALRPETRLAAKDVMQQFMNTQAALIQSPGILRDTLDELLVRETEWYRSFESGGRQDVAATLIDMKERLSAAPWPNSWIIQVSFTWHKPDECKTIVNALVNTYLGMARTSSEGETRDELALVDRTAEQWAEKLKTEQEDLERLRVAKDIPLLKTRLARLGSNADAINQELVKALTEKDEAQAVYDMYHEPGARVRMAETPEMRQMVENHPLIRAYSNRLADLNITLEMAKERGPKNYMVKRIESQMKHIENEMLAKKTELQAELFRQMRERTMVALDTATAKVNGLQDRLAEAKLELAGVEEQLAIYFRSEERIRETRQRLKEIERYREDLRMQLEDPGLVRVTLRAPAPTPLRPSSPRWEINIAAGVVLGLFLAVGLAFLLEFMSTTVKSPADVVRQLNMPLLGQIPSQEDDEASPADMNRVLTESPQSMLAESFRQLRANLLFSAPVEEQRSILITSSSPEEGKTCVAVNLATALALAGRKILLVDANFRRPGIAEALGISDTSEGLSNILVGHANPETLIKKSPHENLDVLPTGPACPNPAELLGGNHLKSFLTQFNAKYETIIFDGPPLLVVSDGLVLATSIDGVILVVRAGVCARGTIHRAREQLRKVNAKLLGVVLNDARTTRGGYFREMYRTYYEYQTPAGLLPEDMEEEEEENEKK